MTRPDGSRLDPGPAQLALALILDATGSERTALALYQRLKEAMVSRWPMDEAWTLPVPQLRAWIEADA